MIGARSLGLAVRGLRWRRASSVTIWLVAVVCVAVAAGGPAYSSAARDAVLQGALRRAPADASGTGVSVSRAATTKPTTNALQSKTEFAFGRVHGAFGQPIMSIQGTGHVITSSREVVASVPIVYRADACRHLIVVHGACVTDNDPGGVMITEASAAARHWRVGTKLVFGDFVVVHVQQFVVRGIYRPVAPTGGYWFGNTHHYFVQNTPIARNGLPQTDAMLIGAFAWSKATFDPHLPTEIDADLALNPSRLHAADVDAFENAVGRALDLAGPSTDKLSASDAVDTNVPIIVDNAVDAAHLVSLPITITAAQLVVLSLAVLFLIMVSASESRAGEVALGKLRGLKPRETVLHAVLEPALLLLAAIPVGVLGSYLLLRAFGPQVLGHDAQIMLTGWTWLAGVGAAVGGLVASLLAGASVMRRSVLEQWRRTERRPRRTSAVADAVIATLAVVGFVELVSSARRDGAGAFLPALAPGLLAVTSALLFARLLPLAGRTAFRATRATRHVGWFVAVRQVARRQGDMRVFALLTVAVALVVFGVSSRSVFDANRVARAHTEVGADRVYRVAHGGASVDAAIARLDPSGHEAVGVHAESLTIGNSTLGFGEQATPTLPTLLIADPARFAKVAYWRSDFGSSASLADMIRPLLAPAPTAPRFTGTAVRMTVRVTIESGGPLVIALGLTNASGAPVNVTLGTVARRSRESAHTVSLSAELPQCATGCALRRISLVPGTTSGLPLFATAVVTAFDTVSASGSASSLFPALRATRWSPTDSETGANQTESLVSAGSGGSATATLTVRSTSRPDDTSDGYGVRGGVPPVLPGLVTTTQLAGANLSVEPSYSGEVIVHPTAVKVLPRSGDAGMFIPRDWFVAARPTGWDVFAPNEVWLSSRAPANFPQRLAALGVTLRGGQSASDRAQTLAEAGPNYAVAMLLIGAIAAALLAVAGAATTLFVSSRRRLYELAAMRSLGMRPRRLLATLVLEQLLVSLFAAVVGLAAGLVGARVALARIPEFVDRPAFPPLLIDLPYLLAVAVGVAAVAVVVGVAAAGGATLVRRAAPSRLREAQQ